jgi:hypothetical protein
MSENMPSQGDLPIGLIYHSIEDVIDGLAGAQEAFLKRRDRRGVFVTAYLEITRELRRRIQAQKFHDGDWVSRYVVAFANLYRKALLAHHEGNRAALPRAWQLSLDTSAAGMALVIQDLLLGINAHINHDLPLALREVGIEGLFRYEDHTAVNDALRETTGIVQDRIAAFYSSGLGALDHLLGDVDEDLASFKFEAARAHAWEMGAMLANARDEGNAALVSLVIDRQAALVGRLVLAPNTPFPWLIEALRAIEQIRPWWDGLAAPRAAVPLGISLVPGVRTRRNLPVGSGSPTSLDEVIERLGEIIARFDRERNRLSIYATVYRRITRKVIQTVERGGFQDPGWMTQLDLFFADRYFKALDLYLHGRLDSLPRCWTYSFEAVRAGRTMVVQDIVLQIVPRVVYDLPITLVEAGLDRDIDRRFHDYEQTYQLFTSELDDIQKLIARKYSRLVAFEDILAGRLDEMISDIIYTRARREAWSDGLALHSEPLKDQREKLITLIDRKAVRAANKALFWDLPPVRLMCQAARKLEDAFAGNWSELVEED